MINREIDAAVCKIEKSAYDELEKKLAWQPIETAPKDGRKVLMFVFIMASPNVFTGRVIERPSGWFCVDDDKRPRKPSHWMPLPEPPNEDHRQRRSTDGA